jgi:hypothetical protein
MRIIHRARPIAALLALTVAATSCDSTYEDLFLNPERSTTAQVPYLFTQSLTASTFYLDYWEAYYRIYRNMSRWGQLTGTQNDEHMMRQNPGQWDAYWRWYYAEKAMYVREMNAVRARLPEAQRSQYDVYIELGKIIDAYNTHLVTDAWGDIPYSEAFTARNATGQNLFPKFDSQESVYDAMLADLKSASDALRDPALHRHNQLARQDVFMAGDLARWQLFANSLRLRLAMRLAEVAPNKARPIVQEILASTNYPVVETNAQNIVWKTGPNTGGDDRGRPTRESLQEVYAPKVMMDLMNAASDPRRQVYFTPDSATNQWVGLPSSPDAQPATINRRTFAHLRPELFQDHPAYPGFVITAAEVWFLRAEAYQRGWAPGNAADAHAEALRQSVVMYYDLYNSNPKYPDLAHPAAAEVHAFATTGPAAFNGTLQRIAEQKWIHLGFNQPYEAWAEQRRTGVPELGVDTKGGIPLERTVRVTYPSTELTNNRQSYAAVQAKDTPTSRVWWDVR